MADRSHTRTNFLGGEWSPSALGRIDLPTYDQALSVSSNGYPIEEGSWTKRGGTILVGPTKNNSDGIVRTWYIATKGTDPGQLQAVQLELTFPAGGTAAYLQVWVWPYTNQTPVYGIAAPYTSLSEVKAVEMIATDLGVYFLSKQTTPWFLTYNVTTDTFLFQDSLFYKLDGPYLDPLHGASQTLNSLATTSGTGGGDVTITITDGAYSWQSSDVGRPFRGWNQPPAWSSGTTYNSGQVVTYDGNFWIAIQNPPTGNVPGTQTQIGNFIVVPWALVPQQGTWAYGWVKSVTSSSVATITLVTGWPNVGSTGSAGKNGFVLDTWQLGVYTQGQYPACGCWHEGRLWLGGALPGRIDASKTNSIGVDFTSGGLVANNGGLGPLFGPTDQFGTVTDDSGISEVFNADGTNMPLWFIPEQAGILMGTPQGEWLISASNLNDPLTPTSIQIHRITKYGCKKTRAIRVGIAIAYIQTFGRRVMELVADVFSGRFIGRHLNEHAKHLSSTQFAELAYQEEPAPLLWARDVHGFIYSCTYRRVSHFGQEDPKFAGWSRHTITRFQGGTNSLAGSICDTALAGGSIASGANLQSQSSIVMLTGTTGGGQLQNCQIEILHPYTEPAVAANAWQSWHLDGGVSGTVGGLSINGAGGITMTISGLPTSYNGATVSVWLCGLDFGDYVVHNNAIVVPYAADPDGIGTAVWINQFYGQNTNSVTWTYWSTPATILANSCFLPCVVGFNFTSQMQVTRPASRDASEGRTGAAFGKTQRAHMWGGTFARTVSNGLVVSAKQTTAGQSAAGGPDTNIANAIVDFPVVFRYPNGNPIPASTLFSGVLWDTINGDYNFDNQITLTSTRPVPFTVASLTGFMDIEDR